MDIIETYVDQLFDTELNTNRKLGGGYPLKLHEIVYGLPKGVLPSIENHPTFSSATKAELAAIYSQVEQISFLWRPDPEKSAKIILQDPWLNAEYLSQGTELLVMMEELSGTMFVLPFEQLLHYKDHVFWLNKDGVKYYPFDVHYNLTACLKEENGVVENNLYLYHNRIPKVFDMKVTLLQYLDLAYKAKCFYNWQMAYINKSGMDWEKMKRMLPKIFPHLKLDLGEFGM